MWNTARSWFAVLLIASAGCDDERKPTTHGPSDVEKVAPIEADRIQVTDLRHSLKGDDWSFSWLEEEGWDFWGYELRAGTAGDVEFTWNEARADRPIARITVRVSPQKPVRLIFGILGRPVIFGPVRVTCQHCRQGVILSGSVQEKHTCDACKETTPVMPEWSEAHTREFRILVLGGVSVRGNDLKSSGRTIQFDKPSQVVFSGRIQRDEIVVPRYAVDVIHQMRKNTAAHEKGERVIARLFPLDQDGEGGSGSSFSKNNEHITFESTSGRTRVRGTHAGYALFVNDQEVELADYPFPVWEFRLSYR